MLILKPSGISNSVLGKLWIEVQSTTNYVWGYVGVCAL